MNPYPCPNRARRQGDWRRGVLPLPGRFLSQFLKPTHSLRKGGTVTEIRSGLVGAPAPEFSPGGPETSFANRSPKAASRAIRALGRQFSAAAEDSEKPSGELEEHQLRANL
jgi:hypothetical protein